MSPEQWEHAKQIFDDALDLPRAERGAFVQGSCGDDASLLEAVEKLLVADEAAGSFLSQGWAGPLDPDGFSLAAGDVVCNRFRIERLLGNGGMGRVYEAFDTELQVVIALKVLRPEIARDPELLRRFRQEVRIAHRITHPNVCRTYHLDRESREGGEITFLTMEFLEGQTLQQRLAETGRMLSAEALEVARQMADAMDAAHRMGIVHRDIKPANVMVCGDALSRRVVITDFGLAKLRSDSVAREESTISVPGRVMGTLAYMAPEQLEAAESTAATDIYAFGLVLYEMVVGRKAFPDSQSLSAAFQRLRQEAPSAKAVVAEVPVEWDAAIRACLEIAPADRPLSAADVMAILDKETTVRRKKRSRFGWKPLALVAGVVLVVSLLWLALRTYGWQADSAVSSGTVVYLAPVQNESGDTALDNVTELLRASLSQSAHINLLNAEKVGDLLQQMGRSADAKIDSATGREIAMRAGAARVLFVKLRQQGGATLMDVDLEQPDNTPTRYRSHWTRSFSWKGSENHGELSPEVALSIREAGNWIRQKVGESSSDIARLDTPPEDVTTKNWEALADFTEADKLAAAGRNEDAVALLKKAVAVDPGFAFAWGRLGELLFSLDRTEEGYIAYNHALDDSLSSRLTRRERDLIKGTYAVDTFDFASAEEAFRDCAAYYESDKLCVYSQVYPLRMLGRVEDSNAVIQRALRMGIAPVNTALMRTYNSVLVRDFAAAKKSILEMQNAGRKDDAAYMGGEVAFLEDRYADAAAEFRMMQSTAADDYDKSESFSLLASVAAEQGHVAEAREQLESGIQFDRSHGLRHGEAMKHVDLAYLSSRAHKLAACLEEVDAALDLDTGPEALTRAAQAVGYAASGGSRAEAQRTLRRMQALVPAGANAVIYEIARHTVAGELDLAQGKPELAIAEYKAADVLASPHLDREGLARAYRTAAYAEKSGEVRDHFFAKAAEAYELLALKPEIIWYSAQRHPPGFFADEVQDVLALPASNGGDGYGVQLRDHYKMLRPAVSTHS